MQNPTSFESLSNVHEGVVSGASIWIYYVAIVGTKAGRNTAYRNKCFTGREFDEKILDPQP